MHYSYRTVFHVTLVNSVVRKELLLQQAYVQRDITAVYVLTTQHLQMELQAISVLLVHSVLKLQQSLHHVLLVHPQEQLEMLMIMHAGLVTLVIIVKQVDLLVV